jgi:hypothetical protein
MPLRCNVDAAPDVCSMAMKRLAKGKCAMIDEPPGRFLMTPAQHREWARSPVQIGLKPRSSRTTDRISGPCNPPPLPAVSEMATVIAELYSPKSRFEPHMFFSRRQGSL